VVLLPEEIPFDEFSLMWAKEILGKAPEMAVRARDRAKKSDDEYLIKYIDEGEQECAALVEEIDEKGKNRKATYRLFEVAQFYHGLERALDDIDERESKEMVALFYRTLSSAAVANSVTSVDGKYEMKDVPDGDYVLYASRTVGDSVVDWAMRVTVDGQDIAIDLHNGTAKSIKDASDHSITDAFFLL